MSTSPDAVDGPRSCSPPELVGLIAALPRPVLIALDVDGVLAPLVEHPSASALVAGVPEALTRLAGIEGVLVAVVSGRQWEDLETQFGFPPNVIVVGSHGLEFGEPGLDLADVDHTRRIELEQLAHRVAAECSGAWVEAKPGGVALHVRQATDDAGAEAISRFVAEITARGGFDVLPGNAVVEVALHRYDKGEAVVRLRDQNHAAGVVFLGDDVTDELGFAQLRDTDVSVKVGPAPSIARFRLPSPTEVRELLTLLANTL